MLKMTSRRFLRHFSRHSVILLVILSLYSSFRYFIRRHVILLVIPSFFSSFRHFLVIPLARLLLAVEVVTKSRMLNSSDIDVIKCEFRIIQSVIETELINEFVEQI